jgi:hypothetical protein
MATYIVHIPVTMDLVVKVEASSEEEAKQMAFDADINFELIGEDKDKADISEVEYHEQIVNGNVFYGVINEIEVEELD